MAACRLSVSSPFQCGAAPRRATASVRLPIVCSKPDAARQSCGLPAISVEALKLCGVGVAALGLIWASPASAGVILKKTELKKVFQEDASAPATVAKPATPKPPSSGGGITLPSFGIGVGTLALPVSILGIAGATAAAYKLDKEFAEFIESTFVKDSGGYAGYEEVLKSGGNGKAVAPPKAAKAVSKGTKKVVKSAAKATSGFISLNFGKK